MRETQTLECREMLIKKRRRAISNCADAKLEAVKIRKEATLKGRLVSQVIKCKKG